MPGVVLMILWPYDFRIRIPPAASLPGNSVVIASGGRLLGYWCAGGKAVKTAGPAPASLSETAIHSLRQMR